MTPVITIVKQKNLIGLKQSMSLMDNKTGLLWQTFMPRRNEVQNRIGTEFYSIQIYEKDHFINFNPQRSFVKYAMVEVANFELVPEGMETLTINEGTYAVFNYKGDASGAPKMFQYIFQTWLPSSGYMLDDRPHFEILGDKYNKDSPDSEEEIWIPVRREL